MDEFPTVRQMLRTVYNAEDGLSEDTALRLYQVAAAAGNNRYKLETELREAFARKNVSWREMLCNDEYEVIDLRTEAEAREHAQKILWEPLFSNP